MPNFYETIKPHLDEIENRVILLGEVSQVTKSEKKNTKLVEFKAEVSFHCLTITKELGNIKKALLIDYKLYLTYLIPRPLDIFV